MSDDNTQQTKDTPSAPSAADSQSAKYEVRVAKGRNRIKTFANKRLYVALATWFGSLGMHFILLPYFALFVLNLDALQYASLYAATIAVALVLMPIPLNEQRLAIAWGPRLWRNLHILAAGLAIGLIATMQTGRLGYEALLAYSALFAVLMLGLSPMRDALQRFGGADIPRTLIAGWLAKNASYDYIKYGFIGCLVLQFLAQIIGYGLAWSTHYALPYVWGLPAVLAILLIGGAISLYNAPYVAPTEDLSDPVGETETIFAQNFWGGAHVIVYAFRRLYGFLLGNFAIGIAVVAPFLLLVPQWVVHLQLDMSGLVLAQLAFWGSAMAMVGWLLYRPQPFLRGLVIWLNILINALAIWLLPYTTGNPTLLLGLCVLWGLNNGLWFSNARVLFQVACPAGSWHRAITIYHYMFLLGSAIGLMGFGWIMTQSTLALSTQSISQYCLIGLLAIAALIIPVIRLP